MEPSALGHPARQHAFNSYVLPEIEVLLRVALVLTEQPADAEDLVQDTLIRAYRACERFDGAHPRAWLLTILRHTHLNRLRGRRPVLLDDPQDWEREYSWPGSRREDTPEEIVIGATFDTAVSQALASLPRAQRLVVTLVDVDGLTYAEAAQALGVPEGTVMSRLHRARAAVRVQLTAAGLAPAASRRRPADHRPGGGQPWTS